MADINLTKQNLPFLLSGNGTLNVHADVPQPDQPLPASNDDLVSVDFGAQGDQSFTFGAADTIKLGIQAQSKNRLFALFPTSSPDRLQILGDHGLGDFFASHPDQLILALVLDASAAANVAGSFSYSVLTASTTLEAGGDVGYTYLHPYVATTHVSAMIPDFFAGLRLPAQVSSGLPVGEVIAFEYGGYLKFGASLAVGYELKGAPSFAINQLHLSEHYDLSVVGKLGLSAQIAGNFAVEARAATDASGTPKPNWVQVIVRKQRNSAFQIAADVAVDATSDLEGLPDSSDEFLGALFGLRAKNWLNVIARVRELSDLDAAKAELDQLAQQFLSEWIGKAFDELSTTEFATFLQDVQKVVDSYENLDNSAITLFDRYFDKLDFLTNQLNQLIALTSWDQLKGEINGDLWEVLRQLTDGDPLTWILGEIKNATGVSIPSLKELQKRVQQTLDLIKSDAHDEIRKVIALAKSKFPLDGFLNDLSKVDSIPKLKALADQKLGAFVERLIGQAIDQIKNSDLGHALDRIHQTLVAVNTFELKLYSKFKDAVHQSFTFQLHAEYNRASESDALIDVEINLNTDLGKRLMQAAGRGDFQDVLASYQPDVVQLNAGTLTHKLTKESSLSVNILGWHDGWHYQGMDRVIVEADQQIVSEKNGGLSVYTTIDMSDERVRQRNSETVQTNFLLRFIGESHHVLQFDAANQQYLIDAITGMAATYDLSLSGTRTDSKRLEYYLSLARDFDLAAQGATVDKLVPLLPPVKTGVDDFGPMTVSYEVRYTDEALRRLFGAALDEAAVRRGARSVVLANYLGHPELTSIGWCYWTQGIYNFWKEQGPSAFTNHIADVKFEPLDASPFAQTSAPQSAVLHPFQLNVLSTLFSIEDSFVSGLQELDALIHQSEISPRDFENALGDIGGALKDLQNFSEGVNSLFAIFDRMVSLQMPSSQARVASLTLTSQVAGQPVTKVFLSGPPPETQPLHLVSPKPAAPVAA